MITIENADVYGFEAAIRGMRNPLNSWDKSDSFRRFYMDFHVGQNDLALMQKLIKAGSDHSKFMRYIIVTCDITAPLYWWKEFDTYKVGTVANSCSTMHKIHAKPFSRDDFSHDRMDEGALTLLDSTIAYLESERQKFSAAPTDRQPWHNIIQTLPSSYNQRRTVHLNYAVLRNMYHARRNHKLNEWRTFCQWIETLPHSKELICCD